MQSVLRALMSCRSAVVLAVSAVLVAPPLANSPASGVAAPPLSIKVAGNHFVDGSGHVVRLLGVNHTSAEYGCVDGFGYDDGHFDNADAAAIASWGADAVRVPLNEDCWLGLNGQPNSSQGADPALTQSGYQHEIENYVAGLNKHGLYAILDLHWTAPGNQVALEQQPMPDFDHSPAFWTSVATTFKNNHAVVFDLFNEPYDPTDPKSGDDGNQADKVTWNCWETGTRNGSNGGAPCITQAYNENNAPTSSYRIAGLQTLLDAVRATGARQPVLAGGLDYANDLGVADHGRSWMTHAPEDPLHQEAAAFHNYMGKACDTATCWKNTLAPIAAHVPVVTGEFAEDNFAERKCAHKKPSSFDATYMKWADSAGVSYLAWGWIVETQAEQDQDGCSAYVLITNYGKYSPANPNGVAVHDHLHALAYPNVSLTAFGAAVRPGNRQVAYTLRSPQNAGGQLSAQTAYAYKVGPGKAHRVSLGSVRFSLTAHTSHTILLTLPPAGRQLLISKRSLHVLITITLTSPHHTRTVYHRTVVLTAR